MVDRICICFFTAFSLKNTPDYAIIISEQIGGDFNVK